MPPLNIIVYFLIIVIFAAIDGWLIHRRIKNEWNRWEIFIIFILAPGLIIAILDIGSWGMLEMIAIGFMIGIAVNRFVQNLIIQREENRELTNRLIYQVEDRFRRRGVE